MVQNRVIPTLLIKDGGLVKTTNFKNPRYVGDPINVIRIFNEKEVDELIIIDIQATKQNKNPDFGLIEKIAGECFMPLCYGGGISSLEEAEKIFKLGVEKISLQTSVINNMDFITQLSKRFGSQSIVVSIDIKKNFWGQYKIHNSSSLYEKDLRKQISEIEKAGAGEILLNNIDFEGTMKGPDLQIIKFISQSLKIPLIAGGGVGSDLDIKNIIENGASAVSVGSYFIFYGKHKAVLISYPKYSELIKLFK